MLANLWKTNSSGLHGQDNPLRLYELVKSHLEDLHDDMIIYHERNTYVAKLSDIRLDEKRFGAKAANIGVLRQSPVKILDRWSFNCTWEHYHVFGSWLFASPYVGYRIMIDPDLIAQIHWCLKKNDLAQAKKLFQERESLGEEIMRKNVNKES